LRGCTGSSYGCGGHYVVRGTTGEEAPANLFSGTELAASESSCPSDRVSRAVIIRSFRFE